MPVSTRIAGLGVYLPETTRTTAQTERRLRSGNPRLKLATGDMFIRGTQNVYPGLYEPIIASLPGVADAAMVGVPDEIGDDRIVVVVVPAEDPPVALTVHHPLVAAVHRALPGLIDAGVLPDAVLAAPDLPRSGRGRKLDRAALTASIAPLLPAILGDPARPRE